MGEVFVPPMIDGVSPSVVYLEKFMDNTNTPADIYHFLCQKFPHILPDEWQRRFDDGLVIWDDGRRVDANSPYCHGRHIYYYRFLENETIVPFEHEIIFENREFMVVDKPHFLTVTPSGNYVRQTLLTRLKCKTNISTLSPIHRLDRETAGLILISKNSETRGIYQSLFKKQTIKKVYHAIAPVHFGLAFPLDVNLCMERGEPFYTMAVVDGVPNSHTRIHRLQVHDGWAKYELYPTTGKLHQLRVHLNHLGIPIKNDPYYPSICHKEQGDFASPLQLLAYSLSFVDPITKQQMSFRSNRTLDLVSDKLTKD